MQYEQKSYSFLTYLGLGSNQGTREKNLEGAIRSIGECEAIQIQSISSYYDTQPWYYENQSRFLNACIEIRCDLSALELLAQLQKIEQEMGRVRTIKNGPRIIDLDILVFGEEIHDLEILKIPHPGILERPFVLVPLVEIAPLLRIPGTKKTVLEELAHRAFEKDQIYKI